MENQNCNCLIVKPQKSFMAAILLSLFLGPVGLLYAGFWSGVIMTILMIGVVFVPKIGNLLFLLLWFIGPYWSVFVCTKHNKL
ncbi:MAG: hypothetical protein PVI75_01645 [Gammaproteobacteria bacterium]|jgi:hypothetical protein